ncbi:MAG: hypothetical protein QXV17_09455 [Candidatus Micrarchaeaceae archaeon]
MNSKTVERVLRKSSLSQPCARHRVRTKTRNLFHFIARGLPYFMAIKGCFTKVQ